MTLLMLFSCSDHLFRPDFSDWTGCLEEGRGTRFDRSALRVYDAVPVPAEATHLYVHAEWDLYPFMTGRNIASLTLDLPLPLVAEYRSEVDDLHGYYVSGQNALPFRSRDLKGVVEVLAIDGERGTVRLDLQATDDSRQRGNVWLEGVVDLRVTEGERCPE